MGRDYRRSVRLDQRRRIRSQSSRFSASAREGWMRPSSLIAAATALMILAGAGLSSL